MPSIKFLVATTISALSFASAAPAPAASSDLWVAWIISGGYPAFCIDAKFNAVGNAEAEEYNCPAYFTVINNSDGSFHLSTSEGACGAVDGNLSCSATMTPSSFTLDGTVLSVNGKVFSGDDIHPLIQVAGYGEFWYDLHLAVKPN